MDLRLSIFGEDKASSAFDSVGSAARQAAKALYDFSKESVKAALEQEKADRQLALAAKELTGAFKDQASAIQSQLGVQDDMVQGIQALLLQYGEAPDKVDATTRAIIDFSAATGQDALSAAKALTSGVESGKGAFKEYGVQLELTGKASKDLEIATEALKKKFGGAAQNEADSLEGQVRGLSVAFGELQESFGGWILGVAKSSGVLAELKKDMSEIGSYLDEKKARSVPDEADRWNELSGVEKGLAAYDRGEGPSSELIAGGAKTKGDLLRRQRELKEALGVDAVNRANATPALPGLTGPDRTTKAGMKGGGRGGGKSGSDRPTGSSWNESETEELQQWFQDDATQRKAAEEEKWASVLELQEGFALKEEEAYQKKFQKELQAIEKNNEKVLNEHRKLQQKIEEQERQWSQIGESIGAAFVSSFAEQMAQLAQGGEFDVVEFIAGLLPAVLGAVGSIWGPGGTAIGTAIGSLGGMGIRAIGKAAGKKHDGGWIDMSVPRYHQGSWVGGDERPAILQTGERVLSRGEVGRMGGAAGVDAAARGGGMRGGITLNISTIDARGTSEWFTQKGGRGFEDALKTGQGPLARLLGEGRLF